MRNEGKKFEDQWKESCRNLNFTYLRLRDAQKWVRGSGTSFTPENPCDAVIHKLPFIWFLEMKSTEGTGMSFYPETPWIKPKDKKGNVMIKHSQVKDLMNLVEKDGVVCGFILNFRERQLKTKVYENETYFVAIQDFIKFAIDTKKSSISRDDAKEIGVYIKHRKKVKNHHYYITEFIDEAIKKYTKCGYLDRVKIEECIEYLQEVLKS